MGIADLIPGISGGTIAFIAGIYPRLLQSISFFSSYSTWKNLFNINFFQFFKKIDGWFLITLFSGILLSIILFSKLAHYLLNEHFELLFGFFFGLVLGSIIVFLIDIKNLNFTTKTIFHKFMFLGFGVVFGFFILEIIPLVTDIKLSLVFLAGFFAVAAMLLPGISGGYILLIMGLYSHIIEAIIKFDFTVISVFVAGCVLGLLVFSKLFHYLINRFEYNMLFLLNGIMIGTLSKLWPWKTKQIEDDVLIDLNIMPVDLSFWSDSFWVLILMIIGVIFATILNIVKKKVNLF